MSRAAFPRFDLTRWAAFGGTALAAAFLLGCLGLLLAESLPVWRQVGAAAYLGGTQWSFRHGLFGALPMLYGTLVVALLALGLAAPLGLGAAVCLGELLPPRARVLTKATVELLAGVPSVVYGLLGVLLLREPMLRLLAPLEPISGDTLATAAVLLAVMILPTIVSLADDALAAVPASERLAARALGLTRTEALFGVVLPRARAGLVAALLLALGRAAGETIAVFLVIGRQDNLDPATLFSLGSLAAGGQTLTTKLGGPEVHIAYGDPRHWAALLGLALLVTVLVLALTWAGARLARGKLA
jgi:phosphate transport system permease protein